MQINETLFFDGGLRATSRFRVIEIVNFIKFKVELWLQGYFGLFKKGSRMVLGVFQKWQNLQP